MSAIVLDTETTGFSPHEERITEIAIQNFETDEILLHTLVNPEKEISEEITKLTGITNEAVADAPKFGEIAAVVADIISQSEAMIGHNPWFDRGMLAASFARCGIMVKFPILICTKRMWDKHEPREDRHLTNAYKRFVHRDGFEGAHGALADTRACGAVLKRQIEEFGLTGLSWQEFDPEQTKWMGPTNHVIIVDGVLVFNVGKNKGTPCHLVEKSFWRWLCSKDFPDHVKELADYLTVVKPNATADELYGFAYGRWG